jgi:polyadenylate-binding protein
LDVSIDNKALHDTFGMFGHILSCKVATDKEGKSKGYGFVHYEAEEAAKQAIERVNGMQIGDATVFVGPFFKRAELENTDPDNFTNLYIKNLPEAWDETTLTSKFTEYGEVVSSVVMQNVDGKRFALVNYKENESAKAAIDDLHRKPLVELGGEAPADDVAKPAAPAASAPSNDTETVEAKEGGDPGPSEDAEVTEEAAVDAELKRAEVTEEAAVDAELKRAEDEFPADLLYVQRAQTRAERREQILKERRQKSGQKDKPPGVRLCVRNLSEDMDSDKLRELFEPYGQVISALAKQDEAGQCRGLGFVVLSTMEEATKAVTETHLKIVDGKPLNVGLAERKKNRGGDGDGHRESCGKGKSGEDSKGKGKGRNNGKGKGKGKDGVAGSKAGAPRPQGPSPFGFQPPLPPGIIANLRPPGNFPGPLLQGVRPPAAGMPQPATYSLRPAMSAGRPPMLGIPPTSMPPGAPMLGAFPLARPPFPFPPPVVPGSPMHMAMEAMLKAGAKAPPAAPMNPILAAGPPPLGRVPLSREVLAQLPPQAQKQQLGEQLFTLIARHRSDVAGKITGMMLELDNDEILKLIHNDKVLKNKIDEAVRMLEKRRT